jgi:hypothetical protein
VSECRYLKRADFPAWALELASDVVETYRHNWHPNCIPSSAKQDNEWPYKYCWRMEAQYPIEDELLKQHGKKQSQLVVDWYSREYLKLITDDRARSIWLAVKKLNIRDYRFMEVVASAYLSSTYELEKESILAGKQRGDFYKKIKKKSDELSALLAKSRFDEFLPHARLKHLDPLISYLETEAKIPPDKISIIREIIESAFPPASFQLADLGAEVEAHIEAGDHHKRTTHIKPYNDDKAVLISGIPFVERKNKDQKGHRAQFKKILLAKLYIETNEISPQIVATACNVIFDKLPELEPADISKEAKFW